MVERYPFVGHARRRRACSSGSSWCATSRPRSRSPAVTDRIFRECVQRGLFTMAYRRQLPPATGAHPSTREPRGTAWPCCVKVFDLIESRKMLSGNL
jgi:hypothetical protein